MTKTTTPMNSSNDGLNILRPDEITEQEITDFRAYYAKTKGKPIPGHEFWLEFRPDVLKRYRVGVRETISTIEPHFRLPHTLAMLHYYAIVGYEDGIRYNLTQCQNRGATVAEVLDVLAIAFLRAGPQGMHYVSNAATDALRNWGAADPDQISRWPAGWSADDGALRSGMDFSASSILEGDIDALYHWYERMIGEVPSYVRLLARRRPNFLKAYRNRYENAIRGGLPKQMMPYLLLNHAVISGREASIRENILLGLRLGVTKEQLIDSICWAFYYGGIESLDLVEKYAGDLSPATP